MRPARQHHRAVVLALLLVCGSSSPAAAGAAASPCVFRVLAVGDSLTRGAVPSASSQHPYSGRMAEVLRSKLAGRADVQVTTAGLDYMGFIQSARDPASGRETGVTLLPYIKQQLAASSSNAPYSWVVLLGGINDLGNSNKSAAEIMPRLVQAYQMALGTGASVLALQPWPNRFVSQSSDNEAQRRALNSAIAAYVASQAPAASSQRPSGSSGSSGTGAAAAAVGPRVYLQPLPADSFDFWSMPAARVAALQDDQLHLTPAGYDKLGEIVANGILAHTPPQQLCGSSGSGSGRRVLVSGWRLPAFLGSSRSRGGGRRRLRLLR